MAIEILVGGEWWPFFEFSHINIGNLIIPIDELHHFSEGWPNHQPAEYEADPPIIQNL